MAWHRKGVNAAWIVALVWCGLSAPVVAAAPRYEFPQFRSAADLTAACSRMLADARRDERRLQALPASADLLAALDDSVQKQEDLLGPVSLLPAVHLDKAIRDAAEACERRHQAFAAAFLQNRRIYRRVKAIEPKDEIDRRFRQDQLDAFEDAGVALSARARARAQAISQTLAALSQDFERRIREDRRKPAFTEAELQGVPPAVWSSAPKDGEGRRLLGLDAPTYQPVVQQAELASTRERMWRAGMTQGGEPNLRTLDRIASLRREKARLMGFDSYADFMLRRRMAGSAAEADAFLASVQKAVEAREVSDLALLRADKAAHLSQPDAVLQRWDQPFYSERVRRALHNVDQEALRRHFPPEASLDFTFLLSKRLFGVSFAPRQQALWHADARVFDVTDDQTGQYLGTLFIDLYPRADKYNHAAVWGFRNVATRNGRTPAAALVVNFNRNGLSLDELETLLHEFGHALHGLLSATRYTSQGGTSTQLDFVEAPSQMLEDWVYDPKVVALFQQVCQACPPVPADVLLRAKAARDFGKGARTARQRLFAAYDLALYGRTHADPMALWARMEGATPLGHVAGSQFPATFAHIAGGYAAGYYGYLWSLVLAEDLRTAFDADRLSADTGARYRREVLAQGGQVAPAEMVRRFLGRPASNEAFFRALARD